MTESVTKNDIKVGDYVRRKPEHQNGDWEAGDKVHRVTGLSSSCIDIKFNEYYGYFDAWYAKYFDKVEMLEVSISAAEAENYIKDYPDSQWLKPALEKFKADHIVDDRELPFTVSFDELKDLGNAWVRRMTMSDNYVNLSVDHFAFDYVNDVLKSDATDKFLVTKLPTQNAENLTFVIPVDEARRINSNAGSCVLNDALKKHDEGDLRAKFDVFIETVKPGDVIQFEDDEGRVSDAFYLTKEGWVALGNLGLGYNPANIDHIFRQYKNYNTKINHLKGANHQ